MTRYLMRWQFLMIKRQMLTFQGLFPLLMGILFQVAFLTVMLIHGTQHLAAAITPVVFYVSLFGLVQVAGSFTQLIALSTLGLLGVAPITPRDKIQMVAGSLMFTAGLNATILSMGIGIVLGLRYGLAGGVLVAAVLWITGFSLYMGLGIGLNSLLISRLPVKMRKNGGVLFLGLLIMVVSPLYALMSQHDPSLANSLGGALVAISAQKSGAWSLVLTLLGVSAGLLIMVLLPLRKNASAFANKMGDVISTDSKEYHSGRFPRGLTRLLLWREFVTLARRPILAIGVLLFVSAMAAEMPGPFYLWLFGILGSQIGATVLALGSPSVLALLYIAPIRLETYWYKRLISLSPLSLLLSLALTAVLLFTRRVLAPITAVDGFVLCFLAMMATSFFAIYFKPTSSQARKRNVVFSTIVMFAVVLVPMGLGVLDQTRPLLGFFVTGACTLGIAAIGGPLIRRKRALQYPFSPGKGIFITKRSSV